MTKFYGSVYNRLEEGRQTEEPYVGMGATEMMYSDRHPFTVQKIVSPTRVIVTEDKWKRIDGNGQSECQEYEYTSVPLEVGEASLTCNHPLAGYFNECDNVVCNLKKEGNDPCKGCKFWKKSAPTNGVTLIKTKRGWKALGQDRRFALGFREKYNDPSF